jgi:hypothetical protein
MIAHRFEMKMLAGLVHEGLAQAKVGELVKAGERRLRSSTSGSRRWGGRRSATNSHASGVLLAAAAGSERPSKAALGNGRG